MNLKIIKKEYMGGKRERKLKKVVNWTLVKTIQLVGRIRLR